MEKYYDEHETRLHSWFWPAAAAYRECEARAQAQGAL